MKTKILSRWYILLAFVGMLIPGNIKAQINYSENFNSGNGGWSTDGDFVVESAFSCNGSSFIGNFYSFWGFSTDAFTVSPSIGASNGDEAILSFNYKLLDYYTAGPTPNTPNWGSIVISYGTSVSGPWTTIETINPSNHIVSASCANRTVSFTPPAAANIYIRVATFVNTAADVDNILFLDDVNVTQQSCSGTPTAVAATASVTEACLNENVILSLNPAYSVIGLNYQWQYSVDGVEYTDVATGGNSASYTTQQSVDTWYRATVSCSAGGDEITSTPVLVESNGQLCYCDIDFPEDVEPITLVNFAGINNQTSATINGTPGVQDFTSLAPAEVQLGETYTITVKGNTGGNYESYFVAYIDFNQNGTLDDDGEVFQIGMVNNSTGNDAQQAQAEITIPEDALTGTTRLRVLKLYDEYPNDPCSSSVGYGYGQAEDYLVNITSGGTLELGYVNLQYPGMIEISQGENFTVYAQAWGEGVTEAPGAAAGLNVWIGISEDNTNPDTWTLWVPATFNVQAGNNDEFMAEIGADLAPGTYYYASRFQLNDGDYVYGGYTSEGGGFWDGTTNISGVLTVNCATEAPMANAEQEFCNSAMVSDLMADGENVLWYETDDSGTPLSDEEMLTDGMYYASQTIDGCESAERTEVAVTIIVVPQPTGESTQTLDIPGSTLNNIVVETEGTLAWYASVEDYQNGTPLDPETPLTDGETYYATQTIGDCESIPFAVIVMATLNNSSFNTETFKYYPNPVTDVLTLSYNKNITGVEVYNLLGQLVLTQPANQNNVAVNMAKLASGSYLVKVVSEDANTTIKVIKQ